MLRHVTTVLGALCIVGTSAAAETQVERGGYLVNAVMACDSCHSPRDPTAAVIPGGPTVERRFSGGLEVWETPAYKVRGSNITTDRNTGIGSWSKDDIERLLTEGVRPDSTHVAPQMPYGFYRVLTPDDLGAVVTYLKTIEPVNHQVPPPVYKTAFNAVSLPSTDNSRGFYLASLAYCMACHSRRPDGVLDFEKSWGKGGFDMKGPWGSVIVPNISSHPVKGVGAWTDAQLKRALTEGIGRDGRTFKLPMARQAFFSRMTQQDLDAIIAWIRTIAPIQ